MPTKLGKSKSASSIELRPGMVGTNLRRARLARGLTLRDVAQRSGVHVTELSKVESGLRLPTLVQTVRLVRVLGLPFQWILNGDLRPRENVEAVALELRHYGIEDLFVGDAEIPGAFRRIEEVLTLALKAKQPASRILEALPAVVAWHDWSPALMEGFATESGVDVLRRVAWLADIALTIERNTGFPGGCRSARAMEELIARVKPPKSADDLGFGGESAASMVVSRRWKILYPATLAVFRERALKLSAERSRAERALT